MNSGAEFMGNAGSQEHAKGPGRGFKGTRVAGDPVIAFVKWRFHIETNPVDKRQHFAKAVRENSGRMETNFVAKVLYRPYCRRKCRLSGWLSSAEHDSLKKIPAFREERKNIIPAPSSLTKWLEVRVVTIPAAPCAALAKNHCGEVPRIVHSGERLEASDIEDSGISRRGIEALKILHRGGHWRRRQQTKPPVRNPHSVSSVAGFVRIKRRGGGLCAPRGMACARGVRSVCPH